MHTKTLGTIKLLLATVTFISILTLVSCNQIKSTDRDRTINASDTTTTAIAPERLGINGKYDQSGLAKRVLVACQNITQEQKNARVYVAQRGSTIILKGTVPNRVMLTKLIAVAEDVEGVTAVNSEQVSIRK